MMKLKEKISLDKVFEKEYKQKLAELESNKEAVITHFLHNYKNGVSHFFKKDAVKYTQEILQDEYPKEEISSLVAEEALQYGIFDTFEVPFPPVKNPKFKFIDLFAGIGGFRLAMQNLGGKCVFTSEWDKEAKKTYKANFGERPFGDITKEETKAFIPDNFDLLCAGFPCQAFSIAGKRGGFEDTRGTLFFDVAEIIKRKQPKAIFLENVKGLTTHDNGKTLQIILNTLEELNYTVFTKIINAKDFGVPQVRERIFIIGFHNEKVDKIQNFEFPKLENEEVFVNDFIENNVIGYDISKHLQEKYLFKKNDGKPQIIDKNSKIQVKTLVSSYHKIQRLTGTFVKDGVTGLRLLSINECKSIMGFPNQFIVPVSRTQAYRQFGNSVAVPAVQATASEILKLINKL
ncbi:MAG: DNA cytosine methyltransferase [Flavobacterium sp.]